ncbi:MAG: hypothetical protein PHF37_11130 [Phycisphaerae bacterium]|nr:hypothetical protein [Phycisphaerae bacterium]
MKTSGSGQLRWVILLLVIAVVLPTVCLLWFMTAAVKNERLAVRQKLVDVCNDRIKDCREELKGICEEQNKNYARTPHLVEKQDILLWINAIKHDADGVVIFDDNGVLVYPVTRNESPSGFDDELQNAFELETHGDYQAALELYQKSIDSNEHRDYLFAAYMGTIRCLDKLKRDTEVLDLFHKIMWSDERHIRSKFTPNQVAMIRVKRVQWLDENKDTVTSGDMFSDLDAWYTPWELYPSYTTIWALEKIIDVALQYEGKYKISDSIKNARQIIQTERISSLAADYLLEQDNSKKIGDMQWSTITTQPILYASKFSAEGKIIFLIKTRKNLISAIETSLDKIPIKGTCLKI